MSKQQDDALIAFYRDGGAQRVLERYPFEAEEEAVIKRAIFASRRQKPQLRIVREADEILQRVISQRKPLKPHPYSNVTVESALEAFKSAERKLSEDTRNKEIRRTVILIVGMILLGLLVYGLTRI